MQQDSDISGILNALQFASGIYTFVAIERHTKLVLNFALGRRNQVTTDIFIEGLRLATSAQNFQITTDGFQPYVSAIENTLF